MLSFMLLFISDIGFEIPDKFVVGYALVSLLFEGMIFSNLEKQNLTKLLESKRAETSAVCVRNHLRDDNHTELSTFVESAA